MNDESKTTYSDDPALAPKGSAASPEEKARNWVQLLVIVALACVAGYFVGNYAKPMVRKWIYGPAVALDDGPRSMVKIRGDEPQLGPDDALVTIVEFSDYQCPYCAKAQAPLEGFLADWDGPPVRVVYKSYPLPHHLKALPAAYAAYAALQQGKYDTMRRWLFEHHGDVDALEDSVLNEMKIDVAKFRADSQSEAVQKAVDADRMAGGIAGIRATPTFLVNGHEYTAHWNEDVWYDVVDWELKAAQKLLEDGVDKRDIYNELIKRNPKKPRLQVISDDGPQGADVDSGAKAAPDKAAEDDDKTAG